MRKTNVEACHRESIALSMVCLSLILLCCFLYLNALTTPDQERTAKIISHLQQFFAPLDYSVPLFGSNQELSHADVEQAELAALAESLRERFAPMPVAIIAQENEVFVYGDSESFFVPAKPEIKAKAIPMLSALARDVKKRGLHAKFLLSANFGSAGPGEPAMLLVSRLAAVSRLLLDLGVPSKNFSTLSPYRPEPNLGAGSVVSGKSKDFVVALSLPTYSSYRGMMVGSVTKEHRIGSE